MPILNRAAEMQDEIAEWRRQIHREPEILFAVEKTAAFVAGKPSTMITSFGLVGSTFRERPLLAWNSSAGASIRRMPRPFRSW